MSNTYESPAQLPVAPPARPTAATVFGILNIAFGALGVCGIIMTAAMFFIPMDPAMVKQNPGLRLMHENGLYRGFALVSIPLGFVATVALVIGGIGLLTDRPYGRQLSIGYAYYALIAGVLGFLLNILIVFPAMMPDLNQGGPEQAAAIGGMVGGVCGGIIGLIYPGLLLYFMYRPNITSHYRAL